MKKWEVIRYCDEKEAEGWITHKIILEVYDFYEEIPDEVVDLICYKPQKHDPVVFMSGMLEEEINTALTHFWLSMVIISDETNKN